MKEKRNFLGAKIDPTKRPQNLEVAPDGTIASLSCAGLKAIHFYTVAQVSSHLFYVACMEAKSITRMWGPYERERKVYKHVFSW